MNRITLQRKKNESGVTILEVSLVVAIVGILSTITFTGYQRFVSKNRLTSVSRIMMSEIKVYQMEAMTKNLNYKIDFDEKFNSYKVFEDTNGDTLFTNDEQLKEVSLLQEFPGITFSAVNDLQFYPRGVVSRDTIIFRSRNDTISLYVMGTGYVESK